MIFDSPLFLFLFLPLTVLFFYQIQKLLGRKASLAWLVLASLFFYCYQRPSYFLLITGSMSFNYLLGTLIVSKKKRKQKMLLLIGVGANLALLGFFKYSVFLFGNIKTIFSINIGYLPALLPVAISFFTFQQIIYLVDIYKGKNEKGGGLNYLLYISFFPQLIAGPIVRPKEMFPQFEKPFFSFNYSFIAIGITLIIFGLFKKIVLADNLSLYVDPVFESAKNGNSIPFFYAWQGALSYTFQIYFDFSGYSDMAVGIARLFGIVLPINFNSPYKAKSIIDFWHRWHITLSNFLRDYIYFSLGGNRKGKVIKSVNLLITMLLGGVWHGAGWTFLLWGGGHGISLMINHLWRDIKKKYHMEGFNDNMIWTVISYGITFLFVVIAWVFFRAYTFSGALHIIGGMSSVDSIAIPGSISKDHVYITFLLMISAIIVWFVPNVYQMLGKIECSNYAIEPLSEKSFFYFHFSLKDSCIVAFVWSVALIYLISGHGTVFIYNDF